MNMSYDYIGAATENDADELITFAKELKTEVINCLKKHHPELIKSPNFVTDL